MINVKIKVVETIKTHLSYSISFFSKNRAFYEIMSRNVVELERPQTTIWRMRVACWIRLQAGKHTHTEICNTYCFSSRFATALPYVIRTLPVLFIFIC